MGLNKTLLASIIAGMGGSLDASAMALFGAGDQGLMLDFSDQSQLYQDSAGSTAVTGYGQPIGKVLDKSGKAHPAIQATAGNRPITRGTPRTVGANIAANGDFASDTIWSKGVGWTIAGTAQKTAGVASDLSQTLTLDAQSSYLVFFNATRTAGTVTPSFSGGATVAGSAVSVTGSHYELLTATTGNTAITFSGDAAFAGSVDNVSVMPVLSFVNDCGWFDGANDTVQTSAINLSASDKATVIFSGIYEKNASSRIPFEIGNYYANTPGSIAGLYDSTPSCRLRGSTTQVTIATPNAEGARANIAMAHVGSFAIDLSGATTADEIKLKTRGVLLTQTPTGADAGGGSLVNGVVTVGAATNSFLFWRGGISRLFIINRTLSTPELKIAESWVRQRTAYCSVLGDSTSGTNSAGVGLSNASSTSAMVGGMIVGAADISYAGDKIADQKTKWTALADKSALQAVFIQVGLNDINTYAGVSKTAAQVIADLQDLVDTVNAAKPTGCKTYICGLTPCRGWIGVSTGQTAAAYQMWLDVNVSIAGGGANPITGVDARITGHTAVLNNGSGYLISGYDHNADGVHISSLGRFIVGQYWRSQLEADGLV